MAQLQGSCVVFLLVTVFVLHLLSTSPHQRLGWGRLEDISHGLSGTTGALFTGEQRRAYAGPTLFGGVHSAQSLGGPAIRTSGQIHRRWAVVTTIFEPSQAVLNVAALQGWAVVVVGDVNSAPFNMTASNVVVLDAAAQQRLQEPYTDIAAQLPWRHFGRKNIGFLYAIQHGAQMIWDFDDDNILKPGVEPRVPSENIYNVLLMDPGACNGAVNPYPHMGGPTYRQSQLPPAWPRGYPLNLIKAACAHRLRPGNSSSVAVVQSLADRDPDVDAMYRLTRPLPFSFAQQSRRTLVLQEGVVAPWNAQATLLLQPALWLSLLPVSVHGRVSDIWRSYIAQRLLWDAGYHIAFAPPMVDQIRSPHNYLADLQAEQDLYTKSGKLIELLQKWRGSAPTMEGRLEALMVELYERDFIELQDVALTQSWLKALTAVGYKFPPVIQRSVGNASGRGVPTEVTSSQQDMQPLSLRRQQQPRWAVFFSDSPEPTPAMKAIAAMHGWHVLVVAAGNRDTAEVHTKLWSSLSNVTYLTTDQQDALGYGIVKLLQDTGTSRKSIGYLYAIKHGAQVVYDVADTVQLQQDHIPMLSCWHPHSELTKLPDSQPCRGEYTMLETSSAQHHAAGPLVFNPYPLFGQPHIHPRGMSDQSFREEIPDACFTRSAARPLIQQAMINGRPDVDCTYHGLQPLNVTFDRSAFAVVLPHNTAAYLNSYNALFLQDAFWALLLPNEASSGMEDVTRGMWAQRLLWDVGGHVALLPATASDRSVRCQQQDPCMADNHSCSELSPEAIMRELVELPLNASSLPARMLEVVQWLVGKGYLQPGNLELMQAWVADLEAVGHQFPPLASRATGGAANTPTTGGYDKQEVTSSEAFNTSQPRPVPSMWLESSGISLHHSFAFPQRWCTRLDTQLVINMNTMGPHITRQIPLLHAVYRPWFCRVFFAGTMSVGSPQNPAQPWLRSLRDQGYYIDCSSHALKSTVPGGHTYACAAAGVLTSQQAIWRPDTADQTLHMLHSNDDVVFSPCMMAGFARNRFWASHNSTQVVNVRSHNWEWFKYDLVGRGNISVTTQAALANAWGPLAARIQQHRLQPDTMFAAFEADLYYVPARHQVDFVRLTEHFQSFYVFSEVAVPAVMGLSRDAPDDVEFFSLARAFHGARDCVHSNISRVLPLGRNASMAVAQACVTAPQFRHMNATHAASTNIFSVHPVKLSIPSVVQHWMQWWLSQDCGARLR